MENREKIGAIAPKLQLQQIHDTHTAADQGSEMLKPFMHHVEQGANHHSAHGTCKATGNCTCEIMHAPGTYHGDFYLVVLTKKERLMQNIIRNYFMPRESCPTPQHDQSVFRYRAASHTIEYLWSVPSQEACLELRQMPLDLKPEEHQLMKFVLDFYDGTLLERARKLNGEI